MMLEYPFVGEIFTVCARDDAAPGYKLPFGLATGKCVCTFEHGMLFEVQENTYFVPWLGVHTIEKEKDDRHDYGAASLHREVK